MTQKEESIKNAIQDEKLKGIIKQTEDSESRILWLEQHYSTFNSEMGEVRNNIKWVVMMVKWEIGIMLSGFGFLAALIINHILGK